MISTDILEINPYAKPIIKDLESCREHIIEDNASYKLQVYEVKTLLEFISMLSTEYIKLQTSEKECQENLRRLREKLNND